MSIVRDLERALSRAERVIGLSERCRPRDFAREERRLFEAWQSGVPARPEFVYPALGSLGGLAQGLDRLASVAESLPGVGTLYAGRARELVLEAELAAHVGSPCFALEAARRFPASSDGDGRQALAWAEAWAAGSARAEPRAGIASDDAGDPESLLSAMRRAVGRLRLPFRVVVHPDLCAAAATGDGVIVIRGGLFHSAAAVERIVRHEIEGHALPRARASREDSGIFAVGTAGGSDDEEGRALLLEERAGCLGPERRAELARRHLAAVALRRGADFVEIVRLLLDLGAELEQALRVSVRVCRGGGLAREIVYLPALCRVRRAFARDPSTERWLERGRIAVSAVDVLARALPDYFLMTPQPMRPPALPVG